ncbi:hypothetical protein DCAR_0103646 [Daucus carota subsp. sativus]|nr:hypothetical protein DCAR_0103646 [Daucus carota subsp. sativus]
MSQDNLNPNPPDDSSGNSQKGACRPAEAPRCPRCDSPNTKFCYYNNYSLSQPRYFCKTCRRYWTKGGALRNIPIGGGCRKNKKMSSKSCSRFASDSMDSGGSSSYLDHLGGFKFSNIGLSSGMNFQTLDTNLPRTFSPVQQYQQLSTNSSFGNFSRTLSSPCFSLENQTGSSSGSGFMGLNFPLSSSGIKQVHGSAQLLQDHDLDIKNNDVVASSIESLSSINQDLHWKLQQQRLGMMMFSEENSITDQKEGLGNTSVIMPPKPQPILFENLEISSRVKDHDVHQAVGGSGSGSGTSGTEWLLDHNSNHSLGNAAQTNSSNTGINGMNQAWGNFYQYTPLP